MSKAFISIICAAAFLNNVQAITSEQQALIQAKFVEVGSECVKDHPVTIEDLALLKQKVFPESSNIGCFAACIFRKIGIFNDKGVLTYATALEHAKTIFVDEKELKGLEEFLTTCAKVNDDEVSDGDAGCDRAKLAFNCYVENYKKFDFDFDF